MGLSVVYRQIVDVSEVCRRRIDVSRVWRPRVGLSENCRQMVFPTRIWRQKVGISGVWKECVAYLEFGGSGMANLKHEADG